MNPKPWKILVDRAQFAEALRIVARTGTAMRVAQAIFTFDGEHLGVSMAGNTAEVSDTGEGLGEVRVPGSALAILARTLPKADPLEIRVEGERLYVMQFSTRCSGALDRRPATPVEEMIPPNSDTFEILLIQSRCSQERSMPLAQVLSSTKPPIA